jgi:hypothetical protein
LIDKLEKSRKQLLQLSDPWQSLKLDENQKKCRSKNPSIDQLLFERKFIK